MGKERKVAQRMKHATNGEGEEGCTTNARREPDTTKGIGRDTQPTGNCKMHKLNKLLYPKLSYEITGAAMDVHNKLGPGWDEEAYHLALLTALRNRGLCAESKTRGVLKNNDLVADTFELDFLVEDKVILELKHLPGRFDPAHYIQLINYLKFWNKDLGILINFGLDRLHYERLPFSPRTGKLKCTGLARRANIEEIFSTILDRHGLGYGTNVYKKLSNPNACFNKFDAIVPVFRSPMSQQRLELKKWMPFPLTRIYWF